MVYYVVWNILDFGKGEGGAACACVCMCVVAGGGHFGLVSSIKGC